MFTIKKNQFLGGTAVPPLPPHAPAAPQLPHSAKLLIDL
jgi:hypothetical protein